MNQQRIRAEGRKTGLTGEHPLGDAGQVLLAVIFAVVWIVDTFVVEYTTFLNQSVSLVVRIPLGVALLILSAYLARTSLFLVFGGKTAPPGVIRKGVFNHVRHPIYLSEILFYLALLMLSISLAAALVFLIAIGFLHHISRHEERLLLERFGEDYEVYMKEVPMWIPRR